MKYLYVILFTDKISKVGYTSNLPSRILSHKQHAKSMGKSVLQIWVTPHPVLNHLESEKQMIDSFMMKFTSLTNEFFSDSEEKEIEKILPSFPFQLVKCESVSYKGSNLVIEISCGDRSRSRKESNSESILKLIQKAGSEGISLGLIKGMRRRISSDDAEKALHELCKDGLITKTKQNHSGNNTEFYVYHIV